MILPTQPQQPIQPTIQQQPVRTYDLIRVNVSHHWLTYLDDEGYRVYEVIGHGRCEELITKDPLHVTISKIKERYGVQTLSVYRDYQWEVM